MDAAAVFVICVLLLCVAIGYLEYTNNKKEEK